MAEEIRKEDAEQKKDRRLVVIDAATKVITSATKVAAKMAATKVAAKKGAAKKGTAKKGAKHPPPNRYERKRLRKV
jgi:hypothetical protein